MFHRCVLAAMAGLLLDTRSPADEAIVSTPLKVVTAYGVGGAVLWLAADSGVTLGEDGTVSVLEDRTGNFALRPVHSNLAPELVPKALHGRPVFRFDGSQALYTADGFADALDHDLTFVTLSRTDGVPGGLEYALYLGGNATSHANRAIAIYGGKEILDGQWVSFLGEAMLKHAYTVSGISINSTLTQAAFYRNGKFVTNGTLDPANHGAKFEPLSGEITMGAATSPVRGWNGDIVEELVFNRQLTPAEMQALWTALSAKYGLHDSAGAGRSP